MHETIHRLLAEPRVPDPPVRVWRDWLVLASVLVSALLETIFRPDVIWRPAAVVVCVGCSVALLYRRVHPLAAVTATLVVVNAGEFASLIVNDRQSFGLYTTAYVLILVYAVFRWGSGRDARATLVVMLMVWSLSWFSVDNTVGDVIGGAIVFCFPGALGLGVRYYVQSRHQRVDQGRLLERERLARELHDTVAHFVSAIAIQAQAGLAVADAQPEAAKTALRSVEEAASRTLIEMRSMVGALRNGESAELAPQAGVFDIERLAEAVSTGPTVEVQLRGDLAALGPLLDATLYRLAQESITNALRHARDATVVKVTVVGRTNDIELTVTDNGDTQGRQGHVPGFGLMGMSERAKLLGGTFVAGPSNSGGWSVSALLPRRKVAG